MMLKLRNLRLLLLVLGIAVLLCALCALAYAWWPLPVASDQAPLLPTLFIPP